MKGIRIYLIVIAMALALFFLRPDFLHFFVWWLMLFGLGVIFFPLTSVLFKHFTTKGYIFSKIIAIAVSGYILWLLASLRILPFRAWTAYLVLALCVGINFFIGRRNKIYENFTKNKDLLRKIVFQETLFILALLFWTFLKGIVPDIRDLEKFMDFGFMNSILRSTYFPPIDMWYAGKPINYYYLGQYFAAYLTQISFIPSQITYNLMIATLFALSFMASFTVGMHLFEIYRQNAANIRPFKHAGTICGLLTGALVTLSGSMHTPVYTIFARNKNPYGNYWFPDATRYIGSNPKVEGDGTIHEFPLYSYVVSDMHAHVINMIFVITVIGLAVSVVMNMITMPPDERDDTNLFRRYWPGFCMIILLTGLFPATNMWDFPIYIVVTGAMYFYANLRLYNYKLKAWLMTLVQVVLTGAVAYLAGFPFNLNFEPISTSIQFVKINSRFYQLCVLYGYQAVFFIFLILTAVLAYKRSGTAAKCEQNNTATDLPLNARPITDNVSVRTGFENFIERSNPADVIAIILFICAFGLIVIPEIIYVKDIYPNDPRANTMFKLTYQAFIMLALGIGYTFSRMFLGRVKVCAYAAVTFVISIVLLCGAFEYPFYAIRQWFGNIQISRYKGLDGTKYMLTWQEQLTKLGDETFPEGQEPAGDPSTWPQVASLADDYQIIQYINQNIKGQPVIAEANDLSYTSFGRIAANTGCPDIFNWYTHQLLWRNAHQADFQERINDLFYLYTTNDPVTAGHIIEKYNISYIVVGKLERAKYRNIINEDELKSLGSIVCQSNDTYLIEVVR